MAHRYIPGGRVVLCDGTYNFGGRVSINKQKANVQGVGGATHIKPTASGFAELFQMFHHHTRVGNMTMLDDADDHKSVTAVVRCASGISWPIIEYIHTHGGGFDLSDVAGAALIEPEIHGSSAAQKYGAQVGARLAGQAQRVTGGMIRRTQAQAILLIGAQKAHVSGVVVNEASEAGLNNYHAVDITTSSTRNVVNANVTQGLAASSLRETTSCSDNVFSGQFPGTVTVQSSSRIYA